MIQTFGTSFGPTTRWSTVSATCSDDVQIKYNLNFLTWQMHLQKNRRTYLQVRRRDWMYLDDFIMSIYLLFHSNFRMSWFVMMRCCSDHRIRMMSQITFTDRGILFDLGTWQDQRSRTVGLKNFTIVTLSASIYYILLFYIYNS